MDWNNGQSYHNPNEQQNQGQPYNGQQPYGWQQGQMPNGQFPQQPYGNWSYDPSQQPNRRANGLAIAALITGLLAVVTICTVYGAFIFGSLSIVFALLSKGKENHMHSLAISGTIIGTIALVITVMLFGASISLLMNDEEFQQEFDSMYEDMYGESFEEQMDDILGSY